MNVCDDCGECHDFDYGDRVRLVQNHMLTGQVIGERNWGTEYLVRLGATVTALWFHDVELEPDEEFYGLTAAKVPDAGDTSAPTAANDNVIQFKKAPALGGVH